MDRGGTETDGQLIGQRKDENGSGDVKNILQRSCTVQRQGEQKQQSTMRKGKGVSVGTNVASGSNNKRGKRSKKNSPSQLILEQKLANIQAGRR